MKSLALFIPEIRNLLTDNNYTVLKDLLKELHPADIARGVEDLEPKEQLAVFKCLSDEEAIQVFEELDLKEQSFLLDSISRERAGKVLDEMASDDRADFFSELSDETVTRLFKLMKREEVADVVQLLKYESDTAGGLMTTDYIALRENITVEAAVEAIRKRPKVEMIHYVYVVDEPGHLVGVASLHSLILAKEGTPLFEVMYPDPIRVKVDIDQEEVARTAANYDLLAVPVIEHDNRLVGIVTVDDIIDVVEKEATEDIYRMAGTVSEDDVHKKSIFRVVGLRLPWLFTCLIGGLISGNIIRFFEITLDETIALAFFTPVILGMGGNVGIQSSTIVVRGIALGYFERVQIFWVLSREMGTGLLLGAICGTLVGLMASLLQMGGEVVALAVGISMFCSLSLATFIGTIFPLIFKRINVDPAISAGPFVTTVLDITGLIIYFTLAGFLLKTLN
ncbi:MAG: magnesium transporter [bacterium]|nr:magnesium transporter [bacterium]